MSCGRWGIDQRLSYKEDAATHALLYGQGASLYVAGPGSEGFNQRRDACTTEDQHAIFGAPGEEPERTPEEIFDRSEPYAPSQAESEHRHDNHRRRCTTGGHATARGRSNLALGAQRRQRPGPDDRTAFQPHRGVVEVRAGP